jgi:hypothetical protein
MKSSLPNPGVMFALNQISKHFAPKPRQEPIDTIDLEVWRDFKCIELIVEVLEFKDSYRWKGQAMDAPEVILGPAYTTRGKLVELTLEESAEAEKKYLDLLEWRAEHLKD